LQGPPDGFQGSQGNQGRQGIQGNQGSQGNQGNQGSQGNQGNQGNQGFQGNQGSQGRQGNTGLTANNAGIPYIFYDYTSPPSPFPNGSLFFDNPSIFSVSNLYFAYSDLGSIAQNQWIGSWGSSTNTSNRGYVVLQSTYNTNINLIFRVNGSVNTSYGPNIIQVPVAYLSGSAFGNSTAVSVSFSRTGDIGSQGNQGNQGAQGRQGLTGSQGNQGFVGGATGAGPSLSVQYKDYLGVLAGSAAFAYYDPTLVLNPGGGQAALTLQTGSLTLLGTTNNSLNFTNVATPPSSFTPVGWIAVRAAGTYFKMALYQ
jgi:hypothetical protein